MTKTICSVYFRDCVAYRPYKPRDRETGHNTRFFLPAAPRDGYTLLQIEEMDELQRLSSDFAPFNAQVSAGSIARDLMNEWGGNAPGDEHGGPGIFICAGNEPTEEELKRARARQARWCQWLVNGAQGEWINGNRNNIKDLHRAAAVWLGMERFEWLKEPEQAKTKKCPLCSSQIDGDAMVCPVCRHIIDARRFYAAQADLKAIEAEFAASAPAVVPDAAPEPMLDAANPQ